MKRIKRLAVLFLIPLIAAYLCLPKLSFAEAMPAQNRPESLSTPLEDIPVEKVEVKRPKTWFLVLLVLAAGGAAAAGGGGGEGGGGGGDSGSSGSGDVSVTW